MSDQADPTSGPEPETSVSEETGADRCPMGTLERGLKGEYDFNINDVISEAFALTKGNKGVLWAAVVTLALVGIPSGFLSEIFLERFYMDALGDENMDLQFNQQLWGNVSALLMTPLTAPIYGGVWMLILKRSNGRQAAYGEVFSYFGKVVPLVILQILSIVLIFVGFLMLLLPGIYLSIAFGLAVPLLVERNLEPWQALRVSMRIVNHYWFRFFVLGAVLGLLTIASALLLVIPLIWAVPTMMIVGGVMYRITVGLADGEPATAGSASVSAEPA